MYIISEGFNLVVFANVLIGHVKKLKTNTWTDSFKCNWSQKTFLSSNMRDKNSTEHASRERSSEHLSVMFI